MLQCANDKLLHGDNDAIDLFTLMLAEPVKLEGYLSATVHRLAVLRYSSDLMLVAVATWTHGVNCHVNLCTRREVQN